MEREKRLSLRVPWFWGPIVLCVEREHMWESHLLPGQSYPGDRCDIAQGVSNAGWPTLALDLCLDLNNVSCYLNKMYFTFYFMKCPTWDFCILGQFFFRTNCLLYCLSLSLYLCHSLSQLNYKAKHENEKFKCHIPPDTPALLQHKVNAYNLSDVSSHIPCRGLSWWPVLLFLDCFTE